MSRSKKTNDLISEEEFTLSTLSSATRPEDDSPGDSYADRAIDIIMGLSYQPTDDSYFKSPANSKSYYSRAKRHNFYRKHRVEV